MFNWTMWNRPTAVAVMAFALLLLAISSTSAYAQDECGVCTNHGNLNQHVATAATPTTDPDDINANEQDGWHESLRTGRCWHMHGICIVGMAEGDPLTAQQLTEVVAEAAVGEDLDRLARLATTPAVQLVANRSAIQITGCDGETVVGHVPVDRYLLSAVEAMAAELTDL